MPINLGKKYSFDDINFFIKTTHAVSYTIDII